MAADGIVIENVVSRLSSEVQVMEARMFYAAQTLSEAVHTEMYSRLITTYITDSKERDTLFSAFQKNPCVKAKADWAIQWLDNDDVSYAERLVANIAVEGIFFSGNFAGIFWLASRGHKLHGLTESNQYISRDENIHCIFGIKMLEHIVKKPSAETVEKIFRSAVNVAADFMTYAVSDDLIGINATSMIQYIQFVTDDLLIQMKYRPIYKVTNPFTFMELISLDGKTNFFERGVTDYKLPGRLTDPQDLAFGLDANF